MAEKKSGQMGFLPINEPNVDKKIIVSVEGLSLADMRAIVEKGLQQARALPYSPETENRIEQLLQFSNLLKEATDLQDILRQHGVPEILTSPKDGAKNIGFLK